MRIIDWSSDVCSSDLVTVFLKQHDKAGQAVLRLGVERLLRPLCALQVLMQDDVAGPGALMRLRHEAVHRGRELRAVLAEGPGDTVGPADGQEIGRAHV